jgi:hypothetical protein
MADEHLHLERIQRHRKWVVGQIENQDEKERVSYPRNTLNKTKADETIVSFVMFRAMRVDTLLSN